jgi:vancomycin resistance protein YoaR
MRKTQEKQQKFKDEFIKILESANKEIQNEWTKQKGGFVWITPNTPKIYPHEFEEKLKGKLADEYHNLLNKTLNQ